MINLIRNQPATSEARELNGGKGGFRGSELRDAVLDHHDSLMAVETPAELLKVGFGDKTCPLCQRFHTGIDNEIDDCNGCNGCPVKNRTGEPHCFGSPHHEVARAARLFIHAPTPATLAALRANLRIEQIFLAGLDYPTE